MMNEAKEHILRTSLLLFLQKSYKEVTMREIVEKTALSKGAFYHYFSSKEQLFKEIVLMFFSMGAMDYSSFPIKSLKRFIDEYLKRIDQSFVQINQMMGNESKGDVSFNFFFIMFDAMKRFPEMMILEEQQYKNDLKVWESVINEAKAVGEIYSSTSNKEIANLFLYCTDGVFIRVVNTEKKVKYKDQLKKAFYSIYDNLKG
jgi:AcrR family transcriptional regulator